MTNITSLAMIVTSPKCTCTTRPASTGRLAPDRAKKRPSGFGAAGSTRKGFLDACRLMNQVPLPSVDHDAPVTQISRKLTASGPSDLRPHRQRRAVLPPGREDARAFVEYVYSRPAGTPSSLKRRARTAR